MKRSAILFVISIAAFIFYSCAATRHGSQNAKGAGDIESNDNFLSTNPQNGSAESQIAGLRYQQSTTIELLEKFIEDYPNSDLVKNAKNQITIKTKKNRLHQVMIERYHALQEVLQVVEELYTAGASGFSDVQYVMIDLLEADLDFCKTDSEKAMIYEKILTRCRDLENRVRQYHEMGRVPRIDLERAKVLPLEAEIILLQQELKILDNTQR